MVLSLLNLLLNRRVGSRAADIADASRPSDKTGPGHPPSPHAATQPPSGQGADAVDLAGG
jgi:hypothetical protein